MSDNCLNKLSNKLLDFAIKRDWTRFHTPQSLAQAVAVEAGELQELFLWSRTPTDDDVKDEMADVFIFLLTMANVCGVDLIAAAEEKLARNMQRTALKSGFFDKAGR